MYTKLFYAYYGAHFKPSDLTNQAMSLIALAFDVKRGLGTISAIEIGHQSSG